jgi:hypothetical protein
MPYYVNRDINGAIDHFSETQTAQASEPIDSADPEISIFTSSSEAVTKVERLIKALVRKGIITREEIRNERPPI